MMVRPLTTPLLFTNSHTSQVWLIATTFSATKNKSNVCIFDGRNIKDGPVARVWMKHPLPHSLHGTWVNELFEPVQFQAGN